MLSLYRESKAPVPVNLKDMLNDLLLLMEGRFNSLGVTVSANLTARDPRRRDSPPSSARYSPTS
jgi:hypothetical protein